MKKGFSIQDYLHENKIELGTIKKEVGSTVYKGGHNDLRKTTYDVKIKDGKFQLDTHKTVLTENGKLITEGSQYPSQEEAEALIEWTNAMNGVFVGGAPIVRKAFQQADDIRAKLFPQIFGDNSPWVVDRKGNKLVVKWDKNKAQKLGL